MDKVELKKYLNDYSIKQFYELIATIKRKNCIAFIGAGISKEAGYPLWPELARQLVDREDKLFFLPEDFEKGETRLIEIISQCKTIMHDGKYYACLRNIFDVRGVDKRPYAPTHILLLHIPFIAYLTTNIDRCMVKAIEHSSIKNIKGKPQIYPLLNIEDFVKAERSLFHIHGIIDEKETINSIILSKEDYTEAYDDKRILKMFLMVALKYHDCFFIGFSMTDPFILNILKILKDNRVWEREKLREQKREKELLIPKNHFVILEELNKKKKFSGPDSDKKLNIYIENFKEREKELKSLDIRPIYYKNTNEAHIAIPNLIGIINEEVNGREIEKDESGIPDYLERMDLRINLNG